MTHPLVQLLTCEHGGNRIPKKYVSLFAGAGVDLRSHRGYDPGALEVFRWLRRRLRLPGFYATTSRLLVDLNRSPGHPDLFSLYTRSLDAEIQSEILRRYYKPYRNKVERWIDSTVRSGYPVMHLSVHSFTPVFEGEERRADLGLLYDSRRAGERIHCRAWKKKLQAALPGMVVRLNYPYLGKADGLVTGLRGRWPEKWYRGVELEINQKYFSNPGGHWKKIARALAQTLSNEA